MAFIVEIIKNTVIKAVEAIFVTNIEECDLNLPKMNIIFDWCNLLKNGHLIKWK